MTNKSLLKKAISIGKYIANEYITKEVYKPVNCWGCEGLIYPSLTGIALLRLYEIKQDKEYLFGVKSIIEYLIKRQMKSGGWPLDLGVTGNGERFHVSDDIIDFTSNNEDLPPTTAALRLIAEYTIATEDYGYDIYLKKGINFLKPFWDKSGGFFRDMMSEKALKLRARPQDYHIFSYQSLYSVSKLIPEAKIYVEPLYKHVKSVFESCDQYTYPLLYGMHAAIIIQKERNSIYVKTVVKKRIENHLTSSSTFLIKSLPGAFGHIDGLRGLNMTEGHLRNSIGSLLAMKFYDKYTNTKYFMNTELYHKTAKWVDSMYINGRYYEWMDASTGMVHGEGSASFYLPIWWILGEI